MTRDAPDIPELPLGLTPTPLEIEEEVCRDIRARRAAGRAKYGKTMERTDLSLRDWLQHALEECYDQAIYLRRAIRDMDEAQLPPPAPESMLLDPELERYVRGGGSLEC